MREQVERKPNGRGAGVAPEKRCKYRTAKGTPCRAARRKESDYCIFHDREFQDRRNEIKGAQTMLERRQTPDSAEGIHALLIRNIEELREGKIEPRVANSIAYHAQLVMANLDDLKSERAKLVPGAMEERLQELIVDKVLDDCEAEIREAGEHAYPARVAQRTAEQAKARAAQAAATAGTPPMPAPRGREFASGVQEVMGPRGMAVSSGKAEPGEK